METQIITLAKTAPNDFIFGIELCKITRGLNDWDRVGASIAAWKVWREINGPTREDKLRAL